MQRGCISLGNIQCSGCGRIIPHAGRYLFVEEEDGKKQSWCVDCSLEKGYARYKVDRREQVLTFFPE